MQHVEVTIQQSEWYIIENGFTRIPMMYVLNSIHACEKS